MNFYFVRKQNLKSKTVSMLKEESSLNFYEDIKFSQTSNVVMFPAVYFNPRLKKKFSSEIKFINFN